MQKIILIAHNVRSCYNIGSILRTADGLGTSLVALSGYSPYPWEPDDARLPHEADKITNNIHKTALGAENTITWKHVSQLVPFISGLRRRGYKIYGLEQANGSVPLPEFTSGPKIALIVGNEISGLEKDILELCDGSIEIPMFGRKESYNVACTAAMALYHCRFFAQLS